MSPDEYRQRAAQLGDEAEQLEAQARALRERAAELEGGYATKDEQSPPVRLGGTADHIANPPRLTMASPSPGGAFSVSNVPGGSPYPSFPSDTTDVVGYQANDVWKGLE